MNVKLRLGVLLSQAPSHQPGVESQPLEETFGGGWGWGVVVISFSQIPPLPGGHP